MKISTTGTDPVSDRAEIIRFVDSAFRTINIGPEGLARLACRAAGELLAEMEEIGPLVARANGFTPRQAEFAIEGALNPLNPQSFEKLWSEQGLLPWGEERAHGHADPLAENRTGLTLIVGGGTIPQPNVQAVLAAMMANERGGGRVLFRPSRFDRVLVPLLLGRMQEIADAEDGNSGEGGYRIADHVMYATWPREDEDFSARVIGAANTLVVFGDDKTQEFFKSRAKSSAQFYGYGPRISFAAVDFSNREDSSSSTEFDELAGKIALDVWAYDQQGCLSPMALYVVGGSRAVAEGLFESLGRGLEVMNAEWGPARSMPAHAAARIHAVRRVYAMDSTFKRRALGGKEVPGWTLLWDEADDELVPLPGFGTLRVCWIPDWSGLVESVRPFWGQLQAMGLGGSVSSVPDDALEPLMDMGLSRVCPLGEMQRPPLDWLHDGHPFYPVRPVD